MSDDDEVYRQCLAWVNAGQDGYGVDKSAVGGENAGDDDFQECRNIVNQRRGSGGLTRRSSGGSGVFSSWWTLIFIILALVIPLGFVAFYTNFTLRWQTKKNKTADKK
jgi:hypothetical protein